MELKLREHQETVLDKLREAMSYHRSVILYGPTGFGKTECAISIMQAVRAKGRKAAMVLDRIVLCDQTSKRLDKYGVEHGVLQAGNPRYRPEEQIQVCSVQTLEARESFPGVDLLIVDEAHIHRQSTSDFIKNFPRVRVIGLSATPMTKGLGQTYEKIVNAVTTHELVESKWLVPLRVFVAQQIDMTGAKKVAGEWSQKEATERGVKVTGDIVSEWVKKTHEIFGGPKKTIVFCAGVKHGEDLVRAFGEAGYNFVSISYRDNDELKRDVIEDFRRPDTEIHGLIATDILTKGFDVSDVYIGISARPFSKSLSSHIQQLGRVMRTHPDKDFAVWLDHSGNYLRFQDDWDDVYMHGVTVLDDGREKAKAEPSDRVKAASKCPACGALWGMSDVCLHCGHIRVRTNEVFVEAGRMVEVSKIKRDKPQASIHDKQSFYGQLLRYARDHGKKDGWAYHKYKEKFGVYPGGFRQEPAPFTSQETLQWIKSRNIAWAKSRGPR
ncbi:MAG TPA: DEAD/DEAH box helicase family protein [Candidatus Krumholzibacteria bacterium]|nr:DEAD/DEAH box helicase family protein [Candidatus Krumholzibacteria bacterium]HPD73446.1 DEAD/DEAH box helicase family protein [Candidatus Krumholzibacteria bacterium]HRY42168.1 DEAD/DEAH box helicase family protein [Candidatus Krumholzibacteria bacterium]